MQVNLVILIGKEDNERKYASKTIELSFAPVVGMFYHDGTWKSLGRETDKEIIKVTIENLPIDDKPYLDVALKPDGSDTVDILSEMYKTHGWTVT